jgi:regulatory protein
MEKQEEKESLEEKAYNKALDFLSFRPRTIAEMRTFLRKHGFDKEGQSVIARLSGLGYLNDASFARNWIINRAQNKILGKRRLREELIKKGIGREIIDEELARNYDESQEFERALALAQKRLSRFKNLEITIARRRLSQFLIRQGFPPSTSWEVSSKLLPEDF